MDTCVTLSDGNKCPVLGLGTFMIKEPGPLRNALDIGYRHLDTALLYDNEDVIGDVLQEYFNSGKLKRSDVFITTKLEWTYMEPDDVIPALENDLKQLKMSYVDLFVVHAPTALKNNGNGDLFPMKADGSGLDRVPVDLCSTWKAMEACVERGLTRSIGVSNFNCEQTRRVWNSASIKPVVNQVEMHPYLQQKKLRQLCSELGVKVMAYAPMGSVGRPDFLHHADEPYLLEDPLLIELSKIYNKQVAQVCIRFVIQCGVAVIPKSASELRQRQNADVFDFDLSDEDMTRISSISGQQYRVFKMKQFKEHPEFPFAEDV